jgi:hypothetical protein
MSINRKYNTIIWRGFLTFMVCIFTYTSCKKFVEIEPPINQTISDEIFKSDDLAISAVTGIYSEMMSSSGKFSSGEVTFYAGMSADELMFLAPSFRDEFVRNQITESGQPTLLIAFWEKAYRFIYTANICLEKMNAPSASLSSQTRRMLEGECRFIRAFCYFHMVNLFGAVPLPVGSDFRVNMTLPRSPIAKVYELIIQDLETAIELLLEQYPTSPTRVRPNKFAALALLSKVYLYRNDWAKAETASTLIINSPLYTLDSLDSVFKKSSVEAIWQLLPVNSTFNNTWEGNIILPNSNTYVITDTLYKSFEPNDHRRSVWLMSKTVPGPPPNIRYYPTKYRIKSNSAKLEYYVVFRLAEQYLIRAEARAHLGKLSEASADLNMIRNRARLPNTTSGTQETLYAAISQERKIELFAEWGNRWYDLKRTQKADAELKELPSKKATWTLNDTLWPIPSSQIIFNPNLTQNPGY